MNKETFAHGIYRLFAAKGRDATPAIVDTWYQLLKDFDEDEIMERFFKLGILGFLAVALVFSIPFLI